ncbi:MAG: 3-methyl-2-oxobutanoate hydroxymethyltransferase [Candidatus Fermentimicrarchaeum limneticum]|uniref:3-methyl-2-oxobutanoate hydroxymethyltransferase n=1 Tax=Fermentimicrarchaeum limneticum TaxID=2795018 RepID=A0A7D6BGN2_FERL1|nr:MAG: 3-methyl-2-oxobutanoate hydroxymethyltransferase [Candidatus Fermentimicrarchaeum limneticum]
MLEKLKGNKKVVMLTAYDYQVARLVEQAGVDLILVGDSLGMVVLGYETTKKVSMDEMLHHTRAVCRGAQSTPVIGDMPIGSYATPNIALENAKKFLEAGADGVKVEGCVKDVIEKLVSDGIPVMGHLGLLPQTAEKYAVVGKGKEGERVFRESLTVDKLGVFSLVLECVPEQLAKRITENVKSVTIGIGAGKYCDGQVLVINDLLGMDDSFKPKHVKRYANLAETIRNAVAAFKKEVEGGKFPDEAHSFH